MQIACDDDEEDGNHDGDNVGDGHDDHDGDDGSYSPSAPVGCLKKWVSQLWHSPL